VGLPEPCKDHRVVQEHVDDRWPRVELEIARDRHVRLGLQELGFHAKIGTLCPTALQGQDQREHEPACPDHAHDHRTRSLTSIQALWTGCRCLTSSHRTAAERAVNLFRRPLCFHASKDAATTVAAARRAAGLTLSM
jgi:hypothetical protein